MKKCPKCFRNFIYTIQGFRLSDFNYICDNNLINEEDTIFNWPNDTWNSLENIYRDSLVSTEVKILIFWLVEHPKHIILG